MIEIRAHADGDVGALAALQRRANPASVLGALGPDVVERFLAAQLAPAEVVGIVAEEDGQLVGYLLGGRFGGATSAFVRTNAGFLARRVLRHPASILRRGGPVAVKVAMAALLRPRRGAERPDRVPPGSFGILAVAVDAGSRRRGVGGALVAGAEREARVRGFDGLHLTVDSRDRGAVGFYCSLGWDRVDPGGDHGGRWLMGKDLRS